MPNALAGEENGTSYSFTIVASPNEIQTYYGKELAKLGWNLFATGQSPASITVMLIFMKDTTMVTLSLIPYPDGLMYVMIVK